MTDTTASRFSRFALVGAALLVVGAIGLKLSRDRGAEAPVAASGPTASDAQTAGAPNPGAQNNDAAIAALEAKLKANPGDADGWQSLGMALFQAQRFAQAATAYRRATVRQPANPDHWSSLGEALVSAGPGDVPPEAKAAFSKAVALDPMDPRARYFLGVAKDIAGDHLGAINDWFALLADTPAGAPWEGDVRRTIEAVGAKDKIEVASRLAAVRPGTNGQISGGPRGPGGPGGAVAAGTVAQLPPGAQQAMIAGMVEGLATKLKANPKNVEGWIMLMRSYTTLGRGNDAGVAYRAAVAANPGAKAQLDGAANALGVK